MEDLIKNNSPLSPERSIGIGCMLSVLDYWFLLPTKRIPESGKTAYSNTHTPPFPPPFLQAFQQPWDSCTHSAEGARFLATSEDIRI